MQRLKRLLALLGAIVLLGVMLTVSIMLFNSKNLSNDVFRGLLVCLIAFPIVAYGYMLLLKWGSSIKASMVDIEETEDDIDSK